MDRSTSFISSTSFPFSTMRRWLGMVILVPTVIQILLAVVSILFSWRTNAQHFDVTLQILLFFPLLCFATSGYFFLKPGEPSQSWPEQVSCLIGLVLGVMLGIVLMLPLQDGRVEYCPADTMISFIFPLAFLFLSFIVSLVFNQPPLPASFSDIVMPLSFAVLFLVIYGGIAWWATRRTGFLDRGLRSALLAAFLTPLTTSITAALIRYVPLLWTATQPMHNQVTPMCFYGESIGDTVFSTYHSFLLATMAPWLFQLFIAFVAGLLGGLFYKFTTRLPKLVTRFSSSITAYVQSDAYKQEQ